MAKCFRFYDSGGAFEVFACGENASYEDVGANNTPYWGGSSRLVTPKVDGVLIMGTGYYYGDTYAQLSIVTSFPINRTATVRSDGNCDSCQATQDKYDCINGACIVSSQYDTPGLYQSLSECEVNCGSTGCSGKCISNEDWAKIEGLANQLKSKNCS